MAIVKRAVFTSLIKRKLAREDGTAAIEAGMLFPLLILLMLGMLDVGYAVLAGQKTIRASQITADLISRKPSVSLNDIDEAISAAKYALQPFETTSFGVDIVSIEYDDDDEPQICWRETRDTEQNLAVMESVAGLGVQGDGIMAVTVSFSYEPLFSYAITGPIQMQEVAYVRGRKSPVVEKNGDCDAS